MQFRFTSLFKKVMGDSEAMVTQGYTSAPYGEYNASVESTGQENASLVNGTGPEPEGGSSVPVENGKASDEVAVTAPGAEHVENAGKSLLPFQSCA